MLLTIAIVTTSSMLCFISLLHFYWVLGGTWGIQSAMPEQYKKDYFKESNKDMMNIATLTVALGLLCFAFIITSNQFFVDKIITPKWSKILTAVIGAIFFIRAIGDFRLFGLFKKKSNSLFARKDSQIFIPLCLFLAASCLFIYLMV